MLKKLFITLEMIKFEHTLFALPFSLLSLVLASQGWPDRMKLLWILLSMAGARSAAMAFNRIADRQIDAANPRTRSRALPAGLLSLNFASGFTFVCSLLFVLAAYQLNPLCFWLSFPVLTILFLYSYTKRFTPYSHFILGLCLGLAPVGTWIAIRGTVQWTPCLLCLVVLLWTAGFDLIYACQDAEFDRRQHLFSIPERYGIRTALRLSSLLHGLMFILLLSLLFLEKLGWISLAGILLVAVLLWYEHLLVQPNDLSRVNAAFFTVNGLISILLLLTIGLDKLI
jgi:4-hydroxybenzoate polyprenyltransferase